MEPADQDRRLSRALARLPAPNAPATLLPGALRRFQVREQPPWYRREWREWPIVWRVLSAMSCAAVVVVALGLSPRTDQLADDALARSQAVSSQVEPTVAALQILWRVVLEPLLPAAFGVILVMGAACAAIGLAISYLVLGRTSR